MKAIKKIKMRLLDKHGDVAYVALMKFLGIVTVIYTVVVLICHAIGKHAGLF